MKSSQLVVAAVVMSATALFVNLFPSSALADDNPAPTAVSAPPTAPAADPCAKEAAEYSAATISNYQEVYDAAAAALAACRAAHPLPATATATPAPVPAPPAPVAGTPVTAPEYPPMSNPGVGDDPCRGEVAAAEAAFKQEVLSGRATQVLGERRTVLEREQAALAACREVHWHYIVPPPQAYDPGMLDPGWALAEVRGGEF